MLITLRDFCKDWERWAASADKTEQGWPSDYPNWASLINAAISSMVQLSLREDELTDIEMCWNISEETEELADYAREHIIECWETLHHLKESSYPNVRWQVFDVLSAAGCKAEGLLREGLEDDDPYCRRRAILSLARLRPKDARQIAERFSQDEDPYIRQAATVMLQNAC
jgi:hypothetical protein